MYITCNFHVFLKKKIDHVHVNLEIWVKIIKIEQETHQLQFRLRLRISHLGYSKWYDFYVY